MRMEEAWSKWWKDLGHVSRCNRDPARTREAFEAGYLAAVQEYERRHDNDSQQDIQYHKGKGC